MAKNSFVAEVTFKGFSQEFVFEKEQNQGSRFMPNFKTYNVWI